MLPSGTNTCETDLEVSIFWQIFISYPDISEPKQLFEWISSSDNGIIV